MSVAADRHLIAIMLFGIVAGAMPSSAADTDIAVPAAAQSSRLGDALDVYRAIEAKGGWPTVPAGPILRLGTRDPGVPKLRQRLILSADLVVDAGTDDAFLVDAFLEHAIKRFQARHGLEVDGLVGPRTRSALNFRADQRRRQMELNMDRWRALSGRLGSTYILVNSAAFRLDVVVGGERVLASRVIAGKSKRPTPDIHSRITAIQFHPPWVVPPRIARLDILPRWKRDPNYLANKGFRLLSGWREDAVELDPQTIDPRDLSPKNFPYRFEQRPGPLNALGRVKFILPNDDYIFLHDTPNPELFDRAERSFSSGCIRVEAALKLAALLLEMDQSASAFEFDRLFLRGETRVVRLRQAVPIHIVYLTAWVADSGTIHFRRDIYDRDKAALSEPEPADQRSCN